MNKNKIVWIFGVSALIGTTIAEEQVPVKANSSDSVLIKKTRDLPISYLNKITNTGRKMQPTNWCGFNDIRDVRGSETYQNGTFVTNVSSRIAKAYGGYRVSFEYYNDSGVLVRSNYVNPDSSSYYHYNNYDYHNYYESQSFNLHISKATVNIVDKHGFYIASQTYVFGDDGGNENHAPVLNGVTDKTIKQNSYFDPKQGVSAWDQEDGDLTGRILVNSNVNTAVPGQYSVTYSVTDSSNYTTTKTITVTVESTDHRPVINGLRDLTIDQGSKFDPRQGVTAIDEEDGDLTNQIVVSGDYVDTNKPGNYTVTYSVTDSDGNTTSKSIVVTVQQDYKKEAPIISAHDMRVKRGSKFDPSLVVAAADAQDGDVTSKVKYSGHVDTNELGDYEIVYTVTDSDNNTATKRITIHVVENLGNAPQIFGANDTTIIQNGYFNPSAGVTATDVEDGNLTGNIKIDSRVNTGQPGDYQVTYVVWDKDYNVTQVTRMIHVKANTNNPPKLQLIASNVTLDKGSSFNPKDYILLASDEEDGDLKDEVTVSGDTVNTNNPGIYNVVYTVKDSDGNTATATLKVTIQGDVNKNHKPVISGAYSRTINLNTPFNPRDSVTASDEEDGDLTSRIKISGNVDTTKVGNYRITYTVTDNDGATTVLSITVSVVYPNPANHKPEIFGAHDFTIEVGDNFNPLTGVRAFDQEDGDLTKQMKIVNSVDRFHPGLYNITYIVTDSKGLTEVKTITVTVVEKDLPPFINAPDRRTVDQFSKFDPRAGVYAYDVEDGELTSKIQVIGSVNTDIPGNYQIVYQITDSHGHTTDKISIITVKEANVPPSIYGAYDQTLTVGQSFDPRKNITANDKEDGDLTNKIAILITDENGNVVDAVDTSKPGVYKVMYSVTDSAGTNTRRTITITVVPAPSIESNGEYSISKKTNTPGFEGDGFIRGTFEGDVKYIQVEFPNGTVGPMVPVQADGKWQYYVANNISSDDENNMLIVDTFDSNENKLDATALIVISS